jgi:hypothetical protein
MEVDVGMGEDAIGEDAPLKRKRGRPAHPDRRDVSSTELKWSLLSHMRRKRDNSKPVLAEQGRLL